MGSRKNQRHLVDRQSIHVTQGLRIDLGSSGIAGGGGGGGGLRGLEHPLCPGHKAYVNVKLLADSFLLCKQKLKFKVRTLGVWSRFGACAYLTTV